MRSGGRFGRVAAARALRAWGEERRGEVQRAHAAGPGGEDDDMCICNHPSSSHTVCRMWTCGASKTRAQSPKRTCPTGGVWSEPRTHAAYTYARHTAVYMSTSHARPQNTKNELRAT